MDLKKKLKRFFTLTRKANDGFTLVELIVVIAILAILAGVGSVGYSGYIKSANKKADMVLVGNIRRALVTYSNSAMGDFKVVGQYEAGLQIPVGYIIVSNEDVGGGRYVTIVSPGNGDNPAATVNAGGVLEDAIIAAYGTNYADSVRLKYDGWNGILNGLFYENAEQMVGKVDSVGDSVLTLLNNLGKLNLAGYGITYGNGNLNLKIPIKGTTTVPVISKDYADSAALMLDVSKKVAAVDKETFVSGWDNANTETDEFGVSFVEGAGREHYSAVRAAYNSCFSNYIIAKGPSFTIGNTSYTHSHYESHASSVENHGQDAMELVSEKLGSDANKYLKNFETGTKFPQVVCGSVLQGGTDDSDSYTTCNACQALLAEYKASEQDKADAEAFYDTMVTGAAEGDEHYDPSNPQAFYDWMNNNANIFSNLYQTANQYTSGSSITMVVYHDTTTGLVDVAISPAEADSRND